MPKILRGFLLLILASLFIPSPVTSDDAAAILRQISLLGSFDTVSAKLNMRIERPGTTRERGLELFYRRQSSASDVLARIISPSFLSNMKFLRKESGPNQVELYLRNSQGVRRILGDRGDEPLFDSDFRTADFMMSSQDSARIVNRTAELIIVEIPPAKPGNGTAKRLHLRPSDYFLLAFEELDNSGRVLRTYRVTAFGTSSAGDYARQSVMEIPGKDQRTWLDVQQISPGVTLADSLFSRLNL